jgi:phenylalanyl-tRNA synthetase beta chain
MRRAEDALCAAGLDEAVTWSFVSPAANQQLGLGPEDGPAPITLHNPLSEDQSVMRTTLLGGLLDAASRNLARGAGFASLFESGRVYLPEVGGGGDAADAGGVLAGHFAGSRPAPAVERHRIGAVVAGALRRPDWRGEAPPSDFYLGKGLIELLCGALRAEASFEPLTRTFLHPGRSAAVAISGQPAGWLGELHPRLAAAFDLPPSVVFEIEADALVSGSAVGNEIYEDLTSFPAVYEDLAVVVDAGVSAAEVSAAIARGGGELLSSLDVFDVYEGEQVEAGKRSLALRLEFRAADRTLTDAEVAERRSAIVSELDRVGGELRG